MDLGIVAQQRNARAAHLASDIADALPIAVSLDVETAATLDVDGRAVESFSDCDLVVSIGGDGTFLYAARHADTTPVLGVNLGEVGFLNAVAPGDAVGVVADEVERFRETGAVRYREVARVVAEGETGWRLGPALNEVAIQTPQRGHGNDLDVDVRVDGDRYFASRADGVLVATPTGSTAYNLSEDGPLVHPNVDCAVITGMCVETGVPSLAVPLDSEIAVRVDDAHEVVVTGDGATSHRVTPPARITVRRGPPARVAGPGLEFFQALAKLD